MCLLLSDRAPAPTLAQCWCTAQGRGSRGAGLAALPGVVGRGRAGQGRQRAGGVSLQTSLRPRHQTWRVRPQRSDGRR
eukprot:5371689-Alexandrium_andersonii.AAC.1